jgi:signal transduction histidine kinase
MPPLRDSGGTLERQQYSALGMRGGLGKTLLTAFLLLAIVPLGLLAFATYNQIQNDTRRKVLASLDTIVALEEAHLVDWAAGQERELGLLAGLCGGDSTFDQSCLAQAAAWLTETQATALALVQAGQGRQGHATQAVQVIAGNDEVLGQGTLVDAIAQGNRAGELATVATSEAGQLPLLAIGYRLPADEMGAAAEGESPAARPPEACGTGGPACEGDLRERYLVALYPWQSLQRLIGEPGQPDVMTQVSLATRDEESGFWILSPDGDLRDFGEAPSGQGLAQEVGQKAAAIEQVLPYAALGTGSGTSSDHGSGAYTNRAGVPVLGAYRWNRQLQVAVVAEQPQTEALAAGNTLTAVIVAITLGMALVTAAIAAAVTRQVTRPIVQLTETAARMARGDLDQPLSGDLRQVAVTRQDEIGVLARAFNRMAAELQVLYGDLNAKVEFLTNMSHALRTQLMSIIGFSRLMLKELDGPLTDLQRTDLAAIHEGGQQLLELINDMLELSDLELETAPMTVDEVDLAGMVDGVMATARALALNKPVELFDEVADDLPTLYTDGRRVRRVLLALVSNAVRITAEGTIRLSAAAADGQVTIRVQATGAKGQAEIFDQNHGNGNLSPAASGPACDGDLGRSGLGLTIGRQVVEKLGGRITVESNGGGEGSGSVFTFTLPISPSDVPR